MVVHMWNPNVCLLLNFYRQKASISPIAMKNHTKRSMLPTDLRGEKNESQYRISVSSACTRLYTS